MLDLLRIGWWWGRLGRFVILLLLLSLEHSAPALLQMLLERVLEDKVLEAVLAPEGFHLPARVARQMALQLVPGLAAVGAARAGERAGLCAVLGVRAEGGGGADAAGAGRETGAARGALLRLAAAAAAASAAAGFALVEDLSVHEEVVLRGE